MSDKEVKALFEKAIKQADLWDWFAVEYTDDYEAERFNKSGWFFSENTIQYRLTGLFKDYSDGYNWEFSSGFWDEVLIYILKSHGFVKTHEGGDEEDGLLIMEFKPQV